MIRDYYNITKPGIIRANAMTAAAGFLFAAGSSVDWWALLGTTTGVALVIGGACVSNNYLDRHIDSRMERTKKRALVTGAIAPRMALIYASVLLICGFTVLALCSNTLTIALGILAVISYVGLYTWAKRHTWHGTLIGSIPGALPPAAGYVAVTGTADPAAWMLFVVMVLWQMPHFYAIAVFRKKDYSAIPIPTLPNVRSVSLTKRFIVSYTALFGIAACCLPLITPTSTTYLVIMVITSSTWLYVVLKGFFTDQNERWARKVFGSSLVVLAIWSTLLAFDVVLP